MIDVAVQQLLVAGSRLPSPQVTPSTEVYPLTQARPRIAYTLLSDPQQYTDDGPMAVRTATYQLDIFADCHEDTRCVDAKLIARADLADAAARGINGFTGVLDNTQIQYLRFGTCRVESGQPIPGQNQTLARCVRSMLVTYRDLPAPSTP